MEKFTPEFTYSRSQIERLIELLKTNSISSALRLAIDEKVIPNDINEILGIWLYKCEKFKDGDDLLAIFNEPQPVLRKTDGQR